MTLLFWGLTIGVVGKVMVVAGVLLSHTTLAHEHVVDDKVLRSFRKEHYITLLGIFMIVVGYFLEIYFYGFTPFKGCDLHTCGAALQAAISQ